MNPQDAYEEFEHEISLYRQFLIELKAQIDEKLKAGGKSFSREKEIFKLITGLEAGTAELVEKPGAETYIYVSPRDIDIPDFGEIYGIAFYPNRLEYSFREHDQGAY